MKKINDEALIKRIGLAVHEGQKPLLEAIKNPKIRDIALACGRRWRKTYSVGYIAFRELLKPNRKIWLVAPTSDLTQKTFSYVIQNVVKLFEPGEYKVTSKPYTKLVMANGSWLECKTADNPVSLIGEELDLLIIDEAARIAPMIYERELAATTMPRKGRTVFISSPKGKNWFYEKFKQIEKSDDGFVWNAPSSDNPDNSPEELERIKKTLPEAIWKQEYLAQFVDSGAEVFRNIREIVLDKELCYEEPIPTHRYILGVDIAKLNDWTVLTMLDKQSHKVVAWDRFQRVDYPIQNNRIASLAKKYNNARIILDSTGGGKVLNDFLTREEGLIIDDFNFSNKSKINLIDKLGQYIENKSVFIPNEPVIINELEVFGLDYTDGGTLIYSAPVGMNDDCVCSLALAVWGLNSTKVRREAPAYIGAKKEERKIEKIKKKKIHR
ncbi:MAG: terminase family protein [Acholeplasmataceae bacterium]|nr:terminase family protein [Acholeplasmataceae bacterium]